LNEAVSAFSDEQLAAARSGDAAALGSLIQAYQRSVYSLALRMLGTRDLAEDLTQDVFMQLNGNLNPLPRPRTWYFGCARWRPIGPSINCAGDPIWK
jgi:DNA-directed RNA polymerase specialized sigma24 family protein